MVHWVYVLECENDFIYVGETVKLFRRHRQHITGRGGSNTQNHKPLRLIGLYKVNDNHSFMRYRNTIRAGEFNPFLLTDQWNNEGDNLLIENHITERFFYERRANTKYGTGNEWYKVRGGKYTRKDLDELADTYRWASEKEGRMCHARNPIADLSVDTIVDRPLCKCGCPSEVKLSKDKTKVFFVCALKNVWDGFCSDLSVAPLCDFWAMYTEDRPLKTQYTALKEKQDTSEKCLIKLH
jgi:predicted GIY-YIG superfamily endonuclease